MDDLSHMTDEELDQAIESGGEISDESQNELEPEEQELVEEQEEEADAEEAEDESEQEEEPKGKEPSRRENLRIQQLLAKMKQQPEQRERPSNRGMDYKQELDADEEVVQKLEQDRRMYGEQLYSQGLEQAKSIQFQTRLEIDAPKVESKYGILNPNDKEQFHPGAANAVNSWYLNMVGYDPETNFVENPNMRYSDFVDGLFELANVIAGQKTEKTTKNIAKQSAQTGLRPDGSSAKRLNLNKAPQDMTDEELDAFLGQAFGK